jgi:YbbR domain-containing protein
MKEKIAKHLSGNLSLRVFSVVLAFMLWMAVINTENPVTTRTFSNMEVTIVNADVLNNLNQTYQIASGDKISFSIRGKKTIVDKLKRTDFEVTADLSELSNVNAAPIKITAKKYADDIEIIYGNDKTMTLEIEDLQQIQVPVTAETTGDPADGYSVGTKTTNPNLVSIKGPVSIVKNIKQIKVEVDVSGASKEITAKVTPVCCDADGKEIDKSRITLDVSKIKVKIAIWKTKKLTLEVKTTGKPADGYTLGTIDYEPKYVYVTGKDEQLSSVSTLELPSIDISNKKSAVEKTIDLSTISLPDGITLVQSDASIMIKVNIDKVQEKDMTIASGDIQLLNQPDGYSVEFEDKGLTLHLTGLSSALSKVDVTSLNPRINLKSLGAGRHEVAVQLDEINNITISGNKTITVLLKEKSASTEKVTEESEEAEATE